VPQRVLLALATVLVVAAGNAGRIGAQGAPNGTIARVTPGSRVRITTPGDASFTGTLVRENADTIVAELASGASLAIPRTRIAQLDVSGGLRRHTWQGAGIGLLAGAGVGAIVGLATYRRSDCGDSKVGKVIVCPLIDGVSRDVTVYGDALLAGAAGTVLGALIGHVGHETWIPIARSQVGNLGAHVEMRRVALALSARF
jgi:hypothetical protein